MHFITSIFTFLVFMASAMLFSSQAMDIAQQMHSHPAQIMECKRTAQGYLC